MTDAADAYRRAVRARHRADAIDRIADQFAAGRLTDLPDVCLIVIERALARDLAGVHDLSRHPYRPLSLEAACD